MAYIYFILFIISLLLPTISFIKREFKKEKWLFIIYTSISIVNLGYMLIAMSKTLEFALFANKITYLGQIFVIISMIFLISKICKFKFNNCTKWTIISIGILMYLLVCTTGYLDWYYKSVELIVVNGASKLVKEYGGLHPLYLVFVIFSFLLMLFIIFWSTKKKLIDSSKLLGLLMTIVFGNVGMWIIEKFIPLDFEFLAISYLVSEFVFFFIFDMLEDYVHLNNITKTTRMLDTKLSVDIITMPMEEKIGKILNNLNDNDKLSRREREILELILQNKKRKEIADELNISENTVKTHTRTLYGKLDVSNREELFAILTK